MLKNVLIFSIGFLYLDKASRCAAVNFWILLRLLVLPHIPNCLTPSSIATAARRNLQSNCSQFVIFVHYLLPYLFAYWMISAILCLPSRPHSFINIEALTICFLLAAEAPRILSLALLPSAIKLPPCLRVLPSSIHWVPVPLPGSLCLVV